MAISPAFWTTLSLLAPEGTLPLAALSSKSWARQRKVIKLALSAHLAGLGHSKAEEGPLALLLARLAAVEHLEGLERSSSAQAVLVRVVVVFVLLLVLPHGVCRVDCQRKQPGWWGRRTLLVEVFRLQGALLLADGPDDLGEHGAAAGAASALVGLVFGVAEVIVVVAVEKTARGFCSLKSDLRSGWPWRGRSI